MAQILFQVVWLNSQEKVDIGVDHPPVADASASGASFGEILAPHQLQLGERGSGNVLSTLTGATQDIDRRERTGGETSPTMSREHLYNGETPTGYSAHVHSHLMMDEGEDEVKDEEVNKTKGRWIISA